MLEFVEQELRIALAFLLHLGGGIAIVPQHDGQALRRQ